MKRRYALLVEWDEFAVVFGKIVSNPSHHKENYFTTAEDVIQAVNSAKAVYKENGKKDNRFNIVVTSIYSEEV